jgi:hypothetical protein
MFPGKNQPIYDFESAMLQEASEGFEMPNYIKVLFGMPFSRLC